VYQQVVLRVPPNDKHWQIELRRQKQDTYRIPIHELSPVLPKEIPGKSSTMLVQCYWGDDMCWILWSHLVLKYNDVQFQKIFVQCVTLFFCICWNECTSVRSDILTVVLLMMHIFWDVILCHWVSGFWYFKKSRCLQNFGTIHPWHITISLRTCIFYFYIQCRYHLLWKHTTHLHLTEVTFILSAQNENSAFNSWLSVHPCYCTKCKTRFFPLNFMLKYLRSSWIRIQSARLDHYEPDSQIIICEQNREHSMTEVKWNNLICWDLAHRLKSRHCFYLQAKKQLLWWILYIELFTVNVHHRNSKPVKICTWEQI